MLPFCHTELRALKPKPSHYPKKLNTLGDHIRSRRLNLDLLQSDVAGKIGVDTTTICNWESNASTPAIRNLPAIIQFLGYNPLPPAQTFVERLTSARRVLGVSQRNLALSLGVDPGTWQSWEAGQHKPIGRNVDLIEGFLRTCGGHAANSYSPPPPLQPRLQTEVVADKRGAKHTEP